MTNVAVIGGGLAGLAAASALVERGVAVTLVESRPVLGGRAGSFTDPTTGEMVDNCQHVAMGCCTNLTDFCRQVGIAGMLRREPVLYFQNENGVVSRFEASRLPAPLHLAPSFLFARFLSLGDKSRIARGMLALMRQPAAPADQSFQEWLMRHGQTPRTCERFWGLVLTSALNESLDRIDFQYARQVFIEGFLANRQACVVEIPQVSLGEFYGKPLERWLADHGVRVMLNCAADELEIANDRVTTCRLKNQEPLRADHFVLTVPYQRVADLLGANVVANRDEFSRLGQLESSPITSAHFWFDREVMIHPHLVVVGRAVQWLFRRPGNCVQAVISASCQLADLGKERVKDVIYAEIEQILPACRTSKLLHWRVVTERSATFSIKPGVDAFRPAQKSSIANLWLAGDYTRTGWPATMEGAVRSGYLAAEGILAALGKPMSIVQPPLAMGWLARWMCRSSESI